ncbi:hypothetical protein CUR46_08630 [Enterococcus faecium]|nr:hypothetical protein CUR46_08630 [Enterococcus faecium]
MSLPLNSESQGAISKNSFSCFMTMVTCDRGVGRRILFIRKEGAVTRLLSQSLLSFYYRISPFDWMTCLYQSNDFFFNRFFVPFPSSS